MDLFQEAFLKETTCKTPISSGMVIKDMADVVFTDSNFQKEVLGEKGMPVLVDFWAPWCGPCRIVGPIVDEIAKEYAGKVKVGKMNVDENPDVSGTFGIMSIPTLLVFKDGQPVKTLIGAQPKEVLKKAVDESLS